MSVFRNSVVGDFTRGGQTTIHFMRMIGQVFKKFFKICLFFYLALTIFISYKLTTDNERYYTFKYIEAYVAGEMFKNYSTLTNIKYSNGMPGKTSYASLLNSKPVTDYVNSLFYKLLLSLFSSFVALSGFGVLLIRFVYSTGKSQAGDDFVRGTEIVEVKILNKLIKKFNKKNNKVKSSNIKLAGVELPYKFDKSHCLLIGSTGTGKSVNFREVLSSIRREGKKAIVYDVAGNFIKHFYREDKDIILNPMDERSRYWNIWSDCKTEGDAISFAESMMPDSFRRDFFDIAAKMVFSSIVYQMGKQDNPTISKLMDLILTVDFETIAKLVEGTDAASILNSEAGKMAASVRGVMSANTRSLKFLKQEGKEFSISDWVNSDDDSWVFVSVNDKQIDMLRPIITAWFNIFTNNVLSLSEDEARRIYMVVDELPSLNKVPSLVNFLAQGRKYGGSAFIGLQNYAQLVNKYGKNEAASIADLCSTWLILRSNSKEGAKWAAENIGNRESIETNEGLSFGVNDIRDGVNVNKNRVDRLVVSPTEIMNLPDLTGFLKLGRGFPVAKVGSKYISYPTLAEPYIYSIRSSGQIDDEDSDNVDFDTDSEALEGKFIKREEKEHKPKDSSTKSKSKDLDLILDDLGL